MVMYIRRINVFVVPILDSVREQLRPYYSEIGRPSVDPELMIRMLIVGYCYGLRSERRLAQEVELATGLTRFPPVRSRTSAPPFFGLWGPRSGSNLRIGWERARHWLWELELEIEKAAEAAAMAKDEAEEAAAAPRYPWRGNASPGAPAAGCPGFRRPAYDAPAMPWR